ncbi:MAG: glycosyl hydrolase family 18 protein [Paenibacillaceae bacterium]
MIKKSLGLLVAIVLLAQLMAIHPATAADLTTKYRVYEENRPVMEYAALAKAKTHAAKLRNSHVELISNRSWVWDNFPRYRVYQNNKTLPQWQFATLEEAKKIAKLYNNSSIRDMKSTGWIWHSYSIPTQQFKLMQNDTVLASWIFNNLASAQKEAKKWSNVHVIDLSTNEWVWDNITAERKEQLRNGEPIYRIYIAGETQDDWVYGYLEDAIHEAQLHDDSVIFQIKKNKEVYNNLKPNEVYQNNRLIKKFIRLDDAIQYAKNFTNTTIRVDQRDIWSNYPYYQVFQNDKLLQGFSDLKAALKVAQAYANASIVTLHDEILWDNKRELIFLSWNGESKPDTIRSHVTPSMGLDIVSPTWFVLEKPDGSMKDTSDLETVKWLKNQSFAIHPLVHNQFDSNLTTAFLNDPKAQTKFITALIDKASLLGLQGLNIDFESISGKNRDAYTTFIRNLTAAGHAKKLIISIDLPRGSLSWNHLTAFDHAKLAEIVDYIITMTYDQHYSGSPTAGSVSGLQWTETGIQEFLSYGIPREKLLLGIPFYVREWIFDSQGKLVGNRALVMRDIPALMASKKTTAVWDASFNQYKITYTLDGLTYVFWLEDEKTVQARLELAKKYDLAGVAAWRLGHEYATIWQTMIKNK